MSAINVHQRPSRPASSHGLLTLWKGQGILVAVSNFDILLMDASGCINHIFRLQVNWDLQQRYAGNYGEDVTRNIR